MGGSIQRSIYKDLNRLLQGNTFLNGTLLRMPKHIKMNIDIDTYEIDLNSEKPTPNQFEMNKLEGNQKSGKSIFDGTSKATNPLPIIRKFVVKQIHIAQWFQPQRWCNG
jgi:hypothetical protein